MPISQEYDHICLPWLTGTDIRLLFGIAMSETSVLFLFALLMGMVASAGSVGTMTFDPIVRGGSEDIGTVDEGADEEVSSCIDGASCTLEGIAEVAMVVLDVGVGVED